MPLTLERIEREASPSSKTSLIFMYHLTRRNLLDIISEISQPLKDMTSMERELYIKLLTEAVTTGLSREEILREIPKAIEKAKK